MRSIFLDELLEPEIDAVTGYLDHQALPSGLAGLYWLPLARELWNETQIRGQKDESWVEGDGYRLAVEVGPAWVRFELLVRSESLLNIGGGQADERQALFVLRWADEMARKLNLAAASTAV
ncbi:MAG: hypothetical protein LBP33_05635 [Candidatus Adiutrix sp.]|jgi:hypothetical protein|nr:hypothetical protein [Candidatus Adiutrix sp.]